MEPTLLIDGRNLQLSRRKLLAGSAAAIALSASRNLAYSQTADGGSPDAIVIGAGAIGCSTAWHLRKRGLKVRVIEAQAQPASQSTNGAAGFVASWSEIHFAGWRKTEWEMQRYGIDFYTQLSKRTKNDIGFTPSGIAYIYKTKNGWKRAQAKIERARQFGTTLESLSAERLEKVTPFLKSGELAGVAFDPDAIRVRAGDAIRELAKELAADGVQFEFNTRVTDFVREGDRVTGVRTTAGDITCDKVFLTAGAWSRPLLAKLGVDCPAKPKNETRYVSTPLPELDPVMPLLIFADHRGLYIREEQGGLLIGGGDNRPHPPDREVDADNPPWCNQLPQDQAQRVREYIREVTNVMPVLAHAEIGSIRSGVPTFTDDSLFIAGPVPGIAGLFMMSGCQEAGVTHGPALGRILSEHALDGKTQWDSSGYLLSRFVN